MNKASISLSCCFIILALVGCGQQNHKTTNLPPSVGQKNEFPEVMVGLWQAKGGFALKFERDGTILRLVHMLAGPVKMEEGGVYMEGPDPNTFAYFAMGPCEAKYHRQTNELEVKIVLDYYEMRLPGGVLKGRTEDYLRGPISKDGKSWTVDWVNYGWLEGATPPDPNLIEANPEKLVFTKIDIDIE